MTPDSDLGKLLLCVIHKPSPPYKYADHDFRLPLQNRWELYSSGLLHSE